MRYAFSRDGRIPSFDDYSSSHIRAGKVYQKRYKRNRGRALMWEFEQSFLRRLFSKYQPRHVLDFACGTGAHLQLRRPAPSWFNVARDRHLGKTCSTSRGPNPAALNICRWKVVRPSPFFGEKHFDLILAFRFFANAESQPRRRRQCRSVSLAVRSRAPRGQQPPQFLVVVVPRPEATRRDARLGALNRWRLRSFSRSRVCTVSKATTRSLAAI